MSSISANGLPLTPSHRLCKPTAERIAINCIGRASPAVMQTHFRASDRVSMNNNSSPSSGYCAEVERHALFGAARHYPTTSEEEHANSFKIRLEPSSEDSAI